MSEQKTITVDQEVEAILKTQQLQYQAAAAVLDGPTGSFYADVAYELAQVIQAYRRGKEPVEVTPDPVFKVGDRVLLTGSEWASMGMLNRVVTVTKTDTSDHFGADAGDAVFEDVRYGGEWLVEPNPDSAWGGKVVDPEIRVGDTVRFLPKDPDEVDIYGQGNQPGVAFVVTGIRRSPWTDPDGREFSFYVYGDPARRAVWDRYIEKVYA